MRGAKGKRIRLKEFITANNTTVSYDTGDEVSTLGPDIEFWGNVKDVRSETTVFDGAKRLDHAKIEILCRTRDVAAVTNGTRLTLDNRTSAYQVSDIYDYDFKFHSIIVANAIIN